MEEIYLPTLHWFAMNNPFSGSCGAFRFLVKPNVVMATAKEVDFDKSCIIVQCWHGPYCYEKSEVEAESTFPMSEQGRYEMQIWLQTHI